MGSLAIGVLMCSAAIAEEADLLESATFRAPKDKGKLEIVVGKQGNALKFSFEKDSQSTFFTSNVRGQPNWDEAAGFSIWVKGDGSKSFGGLQFIYDEDYAVRYDYVFSVQNTEWTKVTVAWRDLIPVLPGSNSKPLGQSGNKPSKLSSFWIGKWWYWRDYPGHSFTLDGFQLEKDIPLDGRDYRPSGPPLARVLDKLKAGKAITIVTMGDSLTDFNHWANRKDSWPVLLKQQLEAKYESKVTIVNPAIGGTQFRQNLILMPRWLSEAPEPDLVTVCFGGNDWDAGMRGKSFREVNQDAIDRIRRATHGKSDVLLLTTVPSVERWTTMAELAEACRQAAQDRSAGLADTEKAFLTAGQENKERLFGFDKVHLGELGHELMAKIVLEAIERQGK